MSSLILQNIETKISVSARRFVSFLATNVENPSSFRGIRETETNFSPFDPFQFFNISTMSGMCTLRNTKIIHAYLLKSLLLYSDIFVANSLLDCYCKSFAMVDAHNLFDEIAHPNLISWNIMISGYKQNSFFEECWKIFCKLRSLGYNPNQFTYGSVLSACSALQDPMFGKFVYSLTIKNGLFSNGYVRTGMIDLFAKNCSFEDALRVFSDVLCENVVCWNAIISGAVRNGENWVALDLFCRMCRKPLVPNIYTFSSILTACAMLEELEIGKGVQGWVIKCGAGEDVFVGTAIVDFYAKCREMGEAVNKFLSMPIRNVVSWTAIISGFVQNDDSAFALQFFKEMRNTGDEINSHTVTSVLAGCATLTMGKEAIQLHSWTIKTGFYMDSVVKASLINVYSKIGKVDISETVFREMESLKNPNTWAVMISAFAQNQSCQKAVKLFQRMTREGLRPDRFCSSSLLSVVDCLYLGRQIHCYNIKTGLVFDVSVGCSLLTMYSKCGNLEESYDIFEQILDKDSVSWSSMIAGLVENGYADRALQLFREMLFEEIIPDRVTYNAVLNACSALYCLHKGKEVHGHAVRTGYGYEVLVGSAVVHMYSKCGVSNLARRVFDMLPQKDQVCCSSLVSGYAQNGHIEEALVVFHEMLMANFCIDSFTVSSVLGAVATLNRPDIGIQLHACTTKLGLSSEVSVGSSLVMMYSKCGSIDNCCKIFDQIEKPDVIGWTAMIVSYAQHGRGADALRAYELMREKGIKPDSVTFVGILSACSHSGLVEEGYFHLDSMTRDYGIEPGNRHYACMVDLLGRSGRLEEAERFVNNMPIKPDALVWGTVLAACKVHGNVELGRLAAEKVIELEPCDAGPYVSLSNICANVGQWEQVLEIRSMMKGTGVVKEPGWSSV
ncbi:pentatricopeptide repeat-containing protein At1g74600, chloroplastic [Malania oleifera]|uniref:pentatricopeptide repeat-containing protein At1g74600, chloroplastic n=1 Tax=Malania oleifera TaxID=397392 RepID=UPI0025AE9648|nr:pentatricopeptide repeat-containing protein At1g74600, chloroplastic [Malania oleifera]